jgi:hypothetical protein
LAVLALTLGGAALVAPPEARTLAMGARDAHRGATDIAERLDEALVGALGDHAASHLLAAEASAVLFALAGSRAVPGGGAARTFTLNEARAPALVGGLLVATAVESAVLHMLLHATHPALAWVLTILGAYGALWLVGHDRATGARVIAVEAEHLVLRAGLRLGARVPWTVIEGAAETASLDEETLDVARPIAEANVVVRLREPIVVTVAFGLRKRVRSVGLRVDDPRGLCAAIAERS